MTLRVRTFVVREILPKTSAHTDAPCFPWQDRWQTTSVASDVLVTVVMGRV